MNSYSRLGEVWIGLADVRQRAGAGVLLDRNQAIVNVLAIAIDEHQFSQIVRATLDGRGFDLIQLEDPEPLAQRAEQFIVAEELLRLAEEVRRTGLPQFGTFHTWVSDE